jgi:hypothetical protein
VDLQGLPPAPARDVATLDRTATLLLLALLALTGLRRLARGDGWPSGRRLATRGCAAAQDRSIGSRAAFGLHWRRSGAGSAFTQPRRRIHAHRGTLPAEKVAAVAAGPPQT